MRHIGWLSLLILGQTILHAPSAFAQKTSTTFDDKFSFAQHQRHTCHENRLVVTRQHPDTNEMMALKIVKAVNQALGARGFLEVKDMPDFYPYYDGDGDSQAGLGGEHRVNSTSTRKCASSWPNRSKTFRQNPQTNPPPRSASSTSPILDRFHLTSCKFCQWPLHDRNS
jgi:hypothetical protein